MSSNLTKCFVTRELMRWPGIESIYGRFLQQTPVFSHPADLDVLIRWARCHRLDLTGLEVGPPSLEEAYLALTGKPAATPKEAPSHV